MHDDLPPDRPAPEETSPPDEPIEPPGGPAGDDPTEPVLEEVTPDRAEARDEPVERVEPVADGGPVAGGGPVENGEPAEDGGPDPVAVPSRARRRATLAMAALGGIVVTLAILVAAGAVQLGSKPTFLAAGASAGVSTAPVTVEVWADFQCPYCGLFTHGLEPTLLRDYAATGRAVLRFRDYAFLGQESLDAAVAARCADRQGRFWAYHDLLYASQNGENQGTFAQANLVKLAAFAGLDTTAFTSCLGDGTVATEVAAETKEGKSLGIESTPTVRIVGPGGTKILKGLTPLKTLTDAIDTVASGKVEASAGSATSGDGGSNGPESSGPESSAAAPSGSTSSQ